MVKRFVGKRVKRTREGTGGWKRLTFQNVLFLFTLI